MNQQDNATVLNTDMATAIYRLAVVILLAGILVMQWQLLGNMGSARPSGASAGATLGDLRTAQGAARQAVVDKAVLVRVHGGFINSGGIVEIDSASVAQIRGGQ